MSDTTRTLDATSKSQKSKKERRTKTPTATNATTPSRTQRITSKSIMSSSKSCAKSQEIIAPNVDEEDQEKVVIKIDLGLLRKQLKSKETRQERNVTNHKLNIKKKVKVNRLEASE